MTAKRNNLLWILGALLVCAGLVAIGLGVHPLAGAAVQLAGAVVIAVAFATDKPEAGKQ